MEEKPAAEDAQKSGKIKIAIVGGGISGCSCAYFLREIFGEKAELVLFEKTATIGGRLETVRCNDREYELGGAILHSSNLYTKQFVKLLNLEKKDDEPNMDLVIYDSKGVLLSLMDGRFFGILDKIKMFNYFGFYQLTKFLSWVTSLTHKFTGIYKYQENGFTFTSLTDLLKKLSPQLYQCAQLALKKVLENKNFNYKITHYLASIACLSNYGQSIEIDGFVGFVSLAGTVGSLWAVKGGNKLIPQKLLEKSNAQVLLNTQIKSIGKCLENPDSKNVVVYRTGNGDEVVDGSFDYVIVGFPIYDGVMGDNFNVGFDTKSEFADLHMQRTNTYFINGNVKLFPELPKNKRLQLHGVDPEVPYRSICVQLPCDFDRVKDSKMFLNDGPKVFKVFAEKNLDSSSFDKIFEKGYEVVKAMPWLAYPKYNQNPDSKSIPSIVLDSAERGRVYYLNAMEWSSSCMEISCISARNIALMIAKKEKVLLENKKPKRFFSKAVLGELNSHLLLRPICFVLTSLSLIAFAYFAGKQ